MEELFTKGNPRATVGSVIREALIAAVASAASYGPLADFCPPLQGDWPIKLAVWVVVMAASAALIEWKIDRWGKGDGGSEHPDEAG